MFYFPLSLNLLLRLLFPCPPLPLPPFLSFQILLFHIPIFLNILGSLARSIERSIIFFFFRFYSTDLSLQVDAFVWFIPDSESPGVKLKWTLHWGICISVTFYFSSLYSNITCALCFSLSAVPSSAVPQFPNSSLPCSNILKLTRLVRLIYRTLDRFFSVFDWFIPVSRCIFAVK